MAERVSDLSVDPIGDDSDTLVINTVNVTDIPLHQPNMLVIDNSNISHNSNAIAA